MTHTTDMAMAVQAYGTMAHKRGTSNSNSRGSSKDRHARKLWLLAEFGDGVTAPCSFECGAVVTYETITVDRHPIKGTDGGKYTRDNIRPSCAHCNYSDGGSLGAERRIENMKPNPTGF